MTSSQLLKITIDWRNNVTKFPPVIQEKQTQNLYDGLRQLPDVEEVNRIADPNVPDGAMAISAWLPEILVLLTKNTPEILGQILKTIPQKLPETPFNFEIIVEENRENEKTIKRTTKISMTGVRPENFDENLAKFMSAIEKLSREKPNE